MGLANRPWRRASARPCERTQLGPPVGAEQTNSRTRNSGRRSADGLQSLAHKRRPRQRQAAAEVTLGGRRASLLAGWLAGWRKLERRRLNLAGSSGQSAISPTRWSASSTSFTMSNKAAHRRSRERDYALAGTPAGGAKGETRVAQLGGSLHAACAPTACWRTGQLARAKTGAELVCARRV